MNDLEIEEQNLELQYLVDPTKQPLVSTEAKEPCSKEELAETQIFKKDINHVDFLWKVIGRYDFYIGTTNAKATMMIAFNVFIISGVILKMEEILPKDHYKSSIVVVLLLAFVTISSLVSLYKTFQVVHPFLKSKDNSRSNIFFIDVAKRKPEEYCESVKILTEKDLVSDLATQVNAVAQGAKSKFDATTSVMFIAFYGQILPLALIMLIKFWFTLTKIQ